MFVTTTDSSDTLLSLASLAHLIFKEYTGHLDFPVYVFQLETDSPNITYKNMFVL